MAFEHIRFAVEDRVGRLTLARAPLNVLNIAMMREMNEVFAGLADRGDVRVVTIAGEGKGFSAGVEVSEHVGEQAREMIEVFHEMFRRMDAIPVPIVALVSGMALGGGCELATLCDLIFASEGAKIGQPEVQVGVFPPVAAAALPRRMGWAAAADLVLTGRVLRGPEALQLGLVSRVFPDGTFDEESDKAVRTMAALSRPVLVLTKKALRAGAGASLGALEEVEAIYLDELMKTSDAHEGLSAFLEKRKPVWKDE